MLTTRTRDIAPLVLDNATNEKSNGNWATIFQTSLPSEWWNYVQCCDTTKNSLGHFQVAESLRIFLKPYQHRINPINQTSDLVPLFSFFIRINKEKSAEVNDLHLAKVVVLLQFLADPNLSMLKDDRDQYLLHSAFEMGQLGLDSLNLLFSYGLTYEQFSLNILSFIKKYLTPNVDKEQVLSLLESPSSLKNAFSEKTNERIYRKILDVSKDNPYTRIYEYLRMAYISYKRESYQQAAGFYQSASRELANIINTEELPHSIKEDYLFRQEQSNRYLEICLCLSNSKNSSRIEHHSDIISRISSFFFTVENRTPANTSLIKYKQS